MSPELTLFQAAMYFSMQFVMHVCSLLDREAPGFGTQRSKQASWSFWCLRVSALSVAAM